jgi:hypothetical protein
LNAFVLGSVGNAYAANQEVNTAKPPQGSKNDYFFVKLHSDPNYLPFMLKNGRVLLFV